MGLKYVTLVAERVEVSYIIQDDDGVYDVSVHERGPEVGLVSHSTLDSLGLAYNISGHTGK